VVNVEDERKDSVCAFFVSSVYFAARFHVFCVVVLKRKNLDVAPKCSIFGNLRPGMPSDAFNMVRFVSVVGRRIVEENRRRFILHEGLTIYCYPHLFVFRLPFPFSIPCAAQSARDLQKPIFLFFPSLSISIHLFRKVRCRRNAPASRMAA
jgi:hypothetical protein